MTAAVLIILIPLMMSIGGIVLAADYRGWRDAAAKAHAGVWDAGYFRCYATFRYVGLTAAVTGALFAVGATAFVIFTYLSK
ncbi:hypothetical protein QMZ92_31225 [Streptomyces sp. HNM0645]|uniref:hypothetical protein n=1 Tax=Streptomyces sp. HNM0645 TaxID=2782343 RepID=UPI0024B84560|nr:hypothetical protein [Streptomyces sp. HNM0645]MDI9888707.1 hypothetical protein [Streptomyces sp. HNM0645]